jgi:hypothetical protein
VVKLSSGQWVFLDSSVEAAIRFTDGDVSIITSRTSKFIYHQALIFGLGVLSLHERIGTICC